MIIELYSNAYVYDCIIVVEHLVNINLEIVSEKRTIFHYFRPVHTILKFEVNFKMSNMTATSCLSKSIFSN